jgi:hypothetical protein
MVNDGLRRVGKLGAGARRIIATPLLALGPTGLLATDGVNHLWIGVPTVG